MPNIFKSQIDRRAKHQTQVEDLVDELAGNEMTLRVKKKTISNLFRYEGRNSKQARKLDLRNFNKPLYLDIEEQTLDVQGLTTFESVINFTLPHGLTTQITPELKHITVGGALVGIGIETNSFRYGFVHDSLLEADVLLPDGRVVLVRPDNKYKDLFYALPNSYGTLGYILRARLKLKTVKPYVRLQTKSFSTTKDLIKAMATATKDGTIEYAESLVYGPDRLYLSTVKQVDSPKKLLSIYDQTPFYKQISKVSSFDLTMKDYLFRYDPEWFWAMADSGPYEKFRKYAPKRLRNSSTYSRFINLQETVVAKLPFDVNDHKMERLIQDWEVPWNKADKLLTYALHTLDLNGKPLMCAPIKTSFPASIYPLPNNELYFNLGSYNLVRRTPNDPDYYYTKLMDSFCFSNGGIKMLYSSTFLAKEDFDNLYNGKVYKNLKDKYDPKRLLPTLYDKAVRAD